MRRNRLPLALALALALGLLGAGPALAQDKTPDQAPPQAQDQAKTKILLLETDHSAEEAKASLQGRSQDHPDGGGGHSPSASHGSGPSASHGGGAGPHR